MNFSDDFEESIGKIIKWLTVVCLVTIVLWGVISIVKIFIPKKDNGANKQTSQKVINENVDNDAQQNTTIETNDNDIKEDSMLLSDNEAQIQNNGKHTLRLFIKELPDEIYFDELTPDEVFAKRKKMVNQKVGENYIDSVLSFGTLIRWNPESFPLKVYIDANSDVPEHHIAEIKNAFTKWQDTTGSFISFVYVDSPNKADIICSYPKDFYRSCSSDISSETSKQYFTYDDNGNIKQAHIDLTYRDCNDEIYAVDYVYAFVLREIGHALGLRGHSGRFSDKTLYYQEPSKARSVRPEITSFDVNTLKLIYSVLPDKTNNDFSEEQRKKLIKPDEVWGSEFERSAVSEQALLFNIEHSPELPSLQIALANHYKENQQYDDALSAYAKSIVLLNESAFKARVYVRIGDTYSEQNKYLEAIEAYKLSLKSLNDKQQLFNVYFNLGVIYFDQEKYEESMTNFQEAIQFATRKDDFFMLLMNLSQVYIKNKSYSNALKCATKAYSLKKTKDSVYLVAYTNYLNKNYEEAKENLEFLNSKVDSLMGYALLAEVYYNMEKYDDLDKLQQNAIRVFGSSRPFMFD